MTSFDALPTPAVLVNRDKVAANIHRMQATCSAHGVELRPHIKTHKMVAVARMQLAAGARGLTCAKLGEAEAMLPSGVREMFIAHSLVDPGKAPRLAALAAQLDDLRVGVTSEGQMEALSRVAAATGRKLNVMLAVDTGLNREGVRSDEAAVKLATLLARSAHLVLRGLYCHEGHFYGVDPATSADQAEAMISRLDQVRKSIDPQLAIWPGCSVTARVIAEHSAGRVQAVRPGAYMFGDLSLARTTGVMSPADVAVEILATVIDRPEPGLALIDAGSKTFSSDRTPLNLFGAAADGRDINVVRVNEEHGYLRGSEVDSLRIGDRIRLVPAHVCTVINLTDTVIVTDGQQAIGTWLVDARGRTQ
jgi:D-serine deaminase-like pyridoxal phosphate-dependent protein